MQHCSIPFRFLICTENWLKFQRKKKICKRAKARVTIGWVLCCCWLVVGSCCLSWRLFKSFCYWLFPYPMSYRLHFECQCKTTLLSTLSFPPPPPQLNLQRTEKKNINHLHILPNSHIIRVQLIDIYHVKLISFEQNRLFAFTYRLNEYWKHQN